MLIRSQFLSAFLPLAAGFAAALGGGAILLGLAGIGVDAAEILGHRQLLLEAALS